jgi:short-subunit dehydrogenase
MKTTNQNVYITGSNRGIGLALAKQAAKRKNHLNLVNRSKLDKKDLDDLKKLGALTVNEISLDLMNKEGINEFITSLNDKRVDVFINNAGLLSGGLIENQKVDEIYDMFQVNVNAVVQICRGLVPIMTKQKSGCIVNNASVSGKMFFPCASTYAASKAAIVAFTESIAQELEPTGVKTLTMITPGVKTDMYDDISNLYGDNLDLDFMSSIPAEDWAGQVFKSLENGDRICWPKGASRIGVWVGHHIPSLMRKVVKPKFKR